MPYTDLNFLHSNHLPDCEARVDKVFAGYHTLQFATAGDVELFYGAERHHLVPGFLWTAFPGPRIRFHAAVEGTCWEHRYAAFAGPRVADWIAEGLWFTRPQRIAPTADFIRRFDELIAAVNGPPTRFGHCRAVNLLESLLIELAEQRQHGADSATPPWLTGLLQAMDGDDFAPEAWASAHGMALPTLRRHFKAATGTPLNEHAIQARLARARALLVETDLPVKNIAERLGYTDVYFFTRQFCKAVGVPPAAFRRSRQ